MAGSTSINWEKNYEFAKQLSVVVVTPDLLRMLDPTGLKASISDRVSSTIRLSESTNLKVWEIIYLSSSLSLRPPPLSVMISPERCDVDLVVFKVLKVESFHVKGSKSIMVLQ